LKAGLFDSRSISFNDNTTLASDDICQVDDTCRVGLVNKFQVYRKTRIRIFGHSYFCWEKMVGYRLCDRINVGLMISYYRLAVAGLGTFGR